jgi:hypothetical protein
MLITAWYIKTFHLLTERAAGPSKKIPENNSLRGFVFIRRSLERIFIDFRFVDERVAFRN